MVVVARIVILANLGVCSKCYSVHFIVVRTVMAHYNSGGTNLSGDSVFRRNKVQLGNGSHYHALDHYLGDLFKW